MKLAFPIVAASVALALSTGCKQEASASTQSTTTQATPAVAAASPKADELFKGRCAPCHGETGHGDGPGAAALNPKPRNYTDVSWQNSVSDEHIKQTILYGGAAVGKSPMMPANPDLENSPDLDGLVKKVRSFKGK